jgi:hypothetical protein
VLVSKLQKSNGVKRKPSTLPENPFAGGSKKITLFPPESSGSSRQINGQWSARYRCWDRRRAQFHRILSYQTKAQRKQSALWATLTFAKDGEYRDLARGGLTLFKLRQFDYHSSSPAFRKRNIINHLQRNAKAMPSWSQSIRRLISILIEYITKGIKEHCTLLAGIQPDNRPNP